MSDNDRATMPKGRPRSGRELLELMQTHTTSDGSLVHVRCFAHDGAARTRYEIVLEGFGRRAVIDAFDREALPARIADALNAFEEAARLRGVESLPPRQ